MSYAVVLLVFQGSSCVAQGAAKIEFETKLHDFGECYQGAIVKRSFVVKNVGTAPLVISRIDPSCECTLIDGPKQPMAPGASHTMVLAFDTADKIGFNTILIRLYHNDASAKDEFSAVPMSLLKIRGEILTKFRATPRYISASGLIRGQTKGKRWTVRVKKEKARPFQLTALKSAPKYLDVRWDRSEGGYKVQVEVKANLGLGELRENILFGTDDRQQPAFCLQFMGRVSTVYGYPKIAYFDPERKEPSVVIPLERMDEKLGLSVRKLEFDRSFMTGGLRVVEAGRAAEIKLWIRPEAPPGPFAKELKIHLDDVLQPLIAIPLIGIVKAKFSAEPRIVKLTDGAKIKQGQFLTLLDLSHDKRRKVDFFKSLTLNCSLDWIELKILEDPFRTLVQVSAKKDVTVMKTKQLYLGVITLQSGETQQQIPVRVD